MQVNQEILYEEIHAIAFASGSWSYDSVIKRCVEGR